ncbi:MAG TPA: glycosyl hydrolase 53 family protein, partial [Catalimonadaceae bacterium]|nr:glycosyl hydrolase 53 family protein [Catalimonadaceae bacterium]
NGCNLVRIRLWNNPATLRSSLSEVQAFAAEVKSNGMKVLLDFHFSDTWADPAHQTKPLAWKTLPDSVLADSVSSFTHRVINIVKPEFVQIGNEFNGGQLWENGRISQPDRFVRFLKSGISACREASPSTKIILHFAGTEGSNYFYNLLKTKSVDYDVNGLSYYPQWHGKNLDSLSNQVNRLSETIDKKIILAECAYPFSLLWADYTNNSLGLESQIIPAYPATSDGQKKFMLQLRKIMEDCPQGLGFCYWAPDLIAFNGPTATNGSHAENQALFDFNYKALPALSVYKP